jgi:Yip1 domain
MGVVTRARNMLVSPRLEWATVAREPNDPASLYRDYLLPLAAIGPVAKVIGVLLFGAGALSLRWVVVVEIIEYALSVFVVVPLWGLLAGLVAGWFGGRNDFVRGLKFIAYGWTAVYVVQIVYILPILGILVVLLVAIAVAYSIYTFHVGVAPMMNVPSGRAIGYLAVTIIVGVAVYFVIFRFVFGLIVSGLIMSSPTT